MSIVEVFEKMLKLKVNSTIIFIIKFMQMKAEKWYLNPIMYISASFECGLD